MLWNQGVHTDRELRAKRPDVIIRNKKEKPYMLVDVTIPADRNFIQKEADKKINTRYSECGT